VPICILYDGKFYDASAFKAAPVPMAIETGTVYEGIRTGVSLGLFTVTGALQTKNSWLGAGNWQVAGSVKPKKKAAPAKPPDEDTDAPPVLRHAGSAPPKAPGPEPQAKPEEPRAKAETPPAAPMPAPAPAPAENDDHPALKRGKQAPFEEKATTTPAKGGSSKTAMTTTEKPTSIQLIPAISDEHGPDPLPFKYELKADEEATFRRKMLALAANLVNDRIKTLAGETIPASGSGKSSRGKGSAKASQPAFDDVDLRMFDLTNSNEPILVLTATAHLPQTASAPNSSLQYFVTLVTRNDIYGDLHKAFVSISDAAHLDVIPRMELIDAVDADGDGRGELLFRQASDAGNAFVIYRVIGDSVYALYQGTPTGG